MRKSPTAREGERFFRGEKEVRRALVNRVHGYLLVKSLSGKKRSLSSSCWALLSSQGASTPLSGLLILLVEVSVY